MRRVRTAVLGVAVAACALGVLSAPAFAKEPVIFGKFVANAFGKTIAPGSPAEAKTKEGEVEDLVLGPVETEECEKELSSKGLVESESSETFFQNVKFSKCDVVGTFGKGANKVKVKDKVSFTLGMEFHSNRSVGIGGEESEVKLSKASISFKISKTTCTIVIPAQSVPLKAETKPEKEFESAEYTTFEEPVEPKKKKLEMFPSGFQKELSVFFELKHVESLLMPNEGCESEQPVNSEGYVEYGNGKIEGELEDISIKNGNLSFEPA
jgi:hypothetical protein